MNNSCLMMITCVTMLNLAFADTSKLSPQLQDLSNRDTICKVWVYFTDKKDRSVQDGVSQRSLARRTLAGYQHSLSDSPIDTKYIAAIEALGGEVQNVYKWENTVSFKVRASELKALSQKPFVRYVHPVGMYKMHFPQNDRLSKTTQSTTDYNKIHRQLLDMMKITQAHYYLRKRYNKNVPGEGVYVGFLDSGYRLDHQCFSMLKSGNRIKTSRDFVDKDNDPQDSDSSLNHGSVVMAQTLGYDPGLFMGSAWGVDVALARTEISERETHIEEDNWVAALVWAESLGVDIVSSSLGYINTFEDSVLVNGKYIVDYPYEYFDGNTTIVSRAAKQAVSRGLLIVCAVGNEGSDRSGTLCGPADVDGVIAVGSVNLDTTISEFSSTGPSADGRKKPDCVAPGSRVVVPRFSSTGTPYGLNYGGTSFSAPRITGIVAMILQKIGKPYTAEEVRKRLYASCSFVPKQDSVDNRAGYGLPDALLSIMDSNDIFIETVDSGGAPLPGASFLSTEGLPVATTDSAGVVILNRLNTGLDYVVAVPGDTVRLSLNKTPFFKRVVLNSKVRLKIKIEDENHMPVTNCMVNVRFVNGNNVVSGNPDVSGSFTVSYGKESEAKIYIATQDYYTPDTTTIMLTGAEKTVVVSLTKIPSNIFIVYPNVLKRSVLPGVKAVFSYTMQGHNSEVIFASIYAVDGTLIWKMSQQSQPGHTALFEWNEHGRNPVAPGIYYFVLRFNKETYRQKFLIAE